MGEIINPILGKYELEKKEILEACQIGKFVYKIDTEIRNFGKNQSKLQLNFFTKY